MKNYKELLNELPSKTAVFTAGRFNPPNVGHELAIKVVRKLAKQRNADHFIFVSSVQDAKTDPLEIGKKMQYLELFFPNTKFVQKEIADAMTMLKRYKTVIMVAPAELVQDYKKTLSKYKFDNVEVVAAGTSCPDCDHRLVKSASKGNYQSFKNGLPTTIRELDAKRLMNDVRSGLGLEPIKEQINLVKDELRERYFRGEIFNEGDIVECDESVYKIIKRGSNHLLLQSESGEKVSKWIQDVKETEREYMLEQKLQEADASAATGKIGGDVKKAQQDTKMAQLQAKQATEVQQLKSKQEREMTNVKTQLKMQEANDSPVVNTKSKYNIAKSLMSLHDFRKTMGMGQAPVQVDNDKETESDIDAAVAASHEPHTKVGHVHMNGNANHNLRRMKVKYHLGEETKEQKAAREEQLKRFHDQSKTVNVDKVHAAGQEPHEEKFEDFKEEELFAQVELDLENLNEDDFYEAYDDEELAIIDEETGEEIEAIQESAEPLMEVLSRAERIRAQARMRRTQTKRQRAEKVALRKFSTPEVANRRARRLAVGAIKKRLLQGRSPSKISIGEKERVERFIQQRRKVVDRLAARMVSRVKNIEKARMSHKKYTKPAGAY